MSNKTQTKTTEILDEDSVPSTEETNPASSSSLTPRNIKKRIARINATEDLKQSKQLRKRLIWAVMKAIADGTANPARRCAQVLVEGFPTKDQQSTTAARVASTD